jgi:hypothetical protein
MKTLVPLMALLWCSDQRLVLLCRSVTGPDLQLEAPGRGDSARHSHVVLTGRCLHIRGDLGVKGRPVDKVDQVDAELGRVGVDTVPFDIVHLPLGQGGVDGRLTELDGRNEWRHKGEERQDTHGKERRRRKNKRVTAAEAAWKKTVKLDHEVLKAMGKRDDG